LERLSSLYGLNQFNQTNNENSILSWLLCNLFMPYICSTAQPTAAIIADWMDYAGISDTLTVIPVVQDDSSNIISVGVTVDSLTGPDILICKVDSDGNSLWKQKYSSAGINRDQPIGVTVDHKCDI